MKKKDEKVFFFWLTPNIINHIANTQNLFELKITLISEMLFQFDTQEIVRIIGEKVWRENFLKIYEMALYWIKLSESMKN